MPPAVHLSRLACAALVLCQPAVAAAFCRTYTCEFDGSQTCDIDPITDCRSGGEVTRWRSGCISYVVQADGSALHGISPEALEGVLQDGFRAWSDAECFPGSSELAGTSPQLSSTSRGATACDAVEYNCGAGDDNANIVMFRDSDSELSPFTIALSTIIANLRTGEILDVDIEINSRDFDFYLDDASASDEGHDLRLVINHELGHLLGLSHTRAAGALMRAEYAGSDRLPSLDDVGGICEIFPVSSSDPTCSAPLASDACVGEDSRCPVVVSSDSGGCAQSGGAPGSPLWVLGLLGLVGIVRCRRRAPRTVRGSNKWQE